MHCRPAASDRGRGRPQAGSGRCVDEAVVVGDEDGLHAVSKPQFRKDVGDVHSHAVFGNGEPDRDVGAHAFRPRSHET